MHELPCNVYEAADGLHVYGELGYRNIEYGGRFGTGLTNLN